MTAGRRRAGLLLPLFSLRSGHDWGIGEIADLPKLTEWLADAGQRILQLLPINELPDHETSPYSALSGMAIDPLYIALGSLPDFVAGGGEGALDADEQTALAFVRTSATVDYRLVRRLKAAALRASYRRFVQVERAVQSSRAHEFDLFVRDEAWWLDSYALFRALRYDQGEVPWMSWPEPLRDKDPSAMDEARQRLAGEIEYRQYLQWVAADQWRVACRFAGDVAIFGDLPFMVATDSADVWWRQGQFRLDASLGVPPDAFSETGQDWNLPVYRWDVVASSDFEWLTARARRYADLFDGYRVDHLVGFFRTFFREPGGASGFTPADEAEQRALGERVLRVFLGSGATIVAEDLGVVPDFVRASMAALDVPGCKVIRWERRWLVDGQPFEDPARYPACSLATTGTHDTEPVVTWWANAPLEERAAFLAVPLVTERVGGVSACEALAATTSMPDVVREALLEAAIASGSDIVLLPVQDVFGWADRINTPAVVDDTNWTWRLPWPVERMTMEPEVRAAAQLLRRMGTRYGR